MNDLIRPTLYEAHHEIIPVVEPAPGAELAVADVVGPVCETGDYLAKARRLPHLAAGDLVAVLSAGAYGAAQAEHLQLTAARTGGSGGWVRSSRSSGPEPIMTS